jgi:alpha-beta hydrolase superfamily lysophospholipase
MKRFFLPFLLLLCTACATPQEQNYSDVARIPALHSKKERMTLMTADTTALPVRRWMPDDKPKAVIVALHGFNDYSRAFEIPAKYLSAHGIGVLAYDQRGFGHSPHSGIWPGQDNLTSDAASMVVAVKKRYPHVPVYLLGESMGGAVVIAAVTRPDFPKVDGVILSAPAVWGGETMNPLFRLSLWTLVHTWPQKVLTGEDLHILASDNIDMLRALGGDPYVIKGTRVDAIYGLVGLMDTAYRNISKIKVPMLLLYGAHDQVIPPVSIVSSIQRLKSNAKIAYYPLGYHMLLRDLHGDVPVRDITAWIADKDEPLPSGYDIDAKKKLDAYLPHRQHPPVSRFQPTF